LVGILLQKMRKTFLNTMQKFFLENSLPLPRNSQKESEMILLIDNISDRVFSKSKFN